MLELCPCISAARFQTWGPPAFSWPDFEEWAQAAIQRQVQDFPTETPLFMPGSRYCETVRQSDEAGRWFGNRPS